MTVVVLAGGTGGAKLARGMLDVAGDLQAAAVRAVARRSRCSRATTAWSQLAS